MTDEELLAFDRRGLIPGPDETEDLFLQRIGKVPTSCGENRISSDAWQEAGLSTDALFGFSPDWIQAYYSNQGLRPWEGAAVWLGDYPMIQLRSSFQRGSFLKVYKREEVLAHEAAHAARIQFEEPRFEELFAYRTSKSTWRKLFGPLFRNPQETLLFLSSTGISMVGSLFINELLSLLPIALLFFFSVRLLKTYSTFSQALRRASLAFLFRLTDKEIAFFAHASEEQIHHYRQQQTSLRWRLLNLIFKENFYENKHNAP